MSQDRTAAQKAADDARARRLAEALRTNLRLRKAQKREGERTPAQTPIPPSDEGSL